MLVPDNQVAGFILAFIIITVLVVYIIRIPHCISNQPDLVEEYYKKNWKWNVPLDFVLVAVYFGLATAISNWLGLEKIWERLVVLMTTTAVLSGTVLFWFRSRPETSGFFSRWFYRAGWSAVVYDVVLLSAFYLTYVGMTRWIRT